MDMTNVVQAGRRIKPQLETVELGIAGVTTLRAVKTIEKAFRGKAGVKEVRVDREGGVARIVFDPRQTHVPDLHDILLASGYHPSRTAD